MRVLAEWLHSCIKQIWCPSQIRTDLLFKRNSQSQVTFADIVSARSISTSTLFFFLILVLFIIIVDWSRANYRVFSLSLSLVVSVYCAVPKTAADSALWLATSRELFVDCNVKTKWLPYDFPKSGIQKSASTGSIPTKHWLQPQLVIFPFLGLSNRTSRSLWTIRTRYKISLPGKTCGCVTNYGRSVK